MAPTATVIVPTQRRAAYLDVALASIAPQAAAAGAELLVVDDGPDAATRAVAAAHSAGYVAHAAPRGLNAARNSGITAAGGELLVFVDDDVQARPGWLAALLRAAAEAPADVGAFAGPIHARFEGRPLRSCGREGPPITFLDLGPADRDAPHAWGANMAVTRPGLARAGRFDEALGLYGDEQEWQARLHAGGGRIRYVAAAAVDHRRAGRDAALGALARAAHARGRASRRFDLHKGIAPSLARELRVLAGCLAHAARFRCANGLVLAAHSLGRLRSAAAETERRPRAGEPETGPPPAGGDGRPAAAATDDFLSGRSGHVAGRRGALLAAGDRALDVVVRPRVARADRIARTRPPRRRVLVVGVDRPGSVMDAARTELERSRHTVAVVLGDRDARGKFERLNALLAARPAAGHDWLVVLDDDVALPRGFLDRFLLCAEGAGLRLAQPAHRLHSHAAWPVTRRRAGGGVREARFVEIGPVTAFHADTFAALLPFPPLRMGWGLDVHWGAVAAQHGWRVGIVDATPVRHLHPAAGGYDRAAAVAEARAFLAERPYVRRAEAGWSRPVALRKAARPR